VKYLIDENNFESFVDISTKEDRRRRGEEKVKEQIKKKI
jgi:hypothetical protein